MPVADASGSLGVTRHVTLCIWFSLTGSGEQVTGFSELLWLWRSTWKYQAVKFFSSGLWEILQLKEMDLLARETTIGAPTWVTNCPPAGEENEREGAYPAGRSRPFFLPSSVTLEECRLTLPSCMQYCAQ